ncbi:addiction module antidote protein, HigA family [Saccharopolyspora karakumensis]|uniref:Addiction module antidote protein, HigA family n=1 Tax=Saccharopolyspora karakumensis TaxID=2530386 RepID=A0A4R5BXY7_9PSEU|nr:HigA family addiction module antitoxin [Saccharopolyspora karakumensis]TDD92061.1 addiction module antidote protein, HigA family [Saccharopolyspora karakumensis]
MSDEFVMPPVHPGDVLAEEYLEPLGVVTQHRLAVAIGVPPRINEIVHGKRGISADTALWLARFFGTSERFWLNLQSRYDLERERDALADTLDRIQPLSA